MVTYHNMSNENIHSKIRDCHQLFIKDIQVWAQSFSSFKASLRNRHKIKIWHLTDALMEHFHEGYLLS